MKDKNEVFTTGEVAQFCGVTLRTVVNWIQRGKLLSYKLPGTRGDNRISADNLKRFLDENNLPYPDVLGAKSEKQKQVLVVEDDSRMAASLSRMLKLEGFNVTIASDGFEAGIQFEKIKPDLVTLDLNMPKLDGVAVLKHLKSLSEANRVIVVSGEGEARLEEAREAGADQVFAKPFEQDALIESIRFLTA